jgi:hypothetical protein
MSTGGPSFDCAQRHGFTSAVKNMKEKQKLVVAVGALEKWKKRELPLFVWS